MSQENISKKIPNALLIGAQKAGTTSLFDWIAQHPQVYANQAIKDCPFFWHDSTYKKGRAFYESFFCGADAQKVLLGGNVNDMYFENTAERIHKEYPNARLILCLRNPIERAYSAYAYAVERGHESRGFADAIREEMAGYVYKNIVDITQKEYIKHGAYWEQLQRFLAVFNRSQMHIVFLDDIKKNPAAVVSEVYRFLDIDDAFLPEFKKKNETKSSASYSGLNKAIFKYSMNQPFWWRVLKNLFSKELRYRMRNGLMILQRKGGAMPPPSDIETKKLLSNYYSSDINGLAQFTGRDLSNWLL